MYREVVDIVRANVGRRFEVEGIQGSQHAGGGVDAEQRGIAASKRVNTESQDKLKAGGMQILPPSAALKADMKKVGDTMLKEWLDANLPAIVETQVRKEVERIARTAG